MFTKILCFTLLMSVLMCNSWVSDQPGDISEDGGKAPFFELPCMRVGGTCARRFACPPETIISETGLCPEQQPQGMECCIPLSGGWVAWPKGGRITKRKMPVIN